MSLFFVSLLSTFAFTFWFISSLLLFVNLLLALSLLLFLVEKLLSVLLLDIIISFIIELSCSIIFFLTSTISSFISFINSSYLLILISSSNTFFLRFTFKFLTLFAICKVNKVSSNSIKAGLTVAIIMILLLPLNEFCNNLVNLDSLHGIKYLFCKVSKLIHLFKARSDLFIEPTSIFPFEFFELEKNEARSLPAKSNNINFPNFVSGCNLTC